MLFCPNCGNVLLLKREASMQWYCQTCPYAYDVRRTMTTTTTLERKQVDDVLGGDDAWKNVDQIDALCEKCGNRRAYFLQIQIRSADEPSSLFYKCTNCAFRWSEI